MSDTNHSQESTMLVARNIFHGEPPFCWEPLAFDTNAAVAALDADGTFLFANEVTCKMIGTTMGAVLGRRLGEFFPPEYAAEREGFLRQALATGQPVTIEEISRGARRLSTFRPMPQDSMGRQRVMLISRPVSSVDQNTPRQNDVIKARHDDLGPLQSLTGRELEILSLIGDGLSTADIAKRLHRSVKTVEWHRVSLGNKLGVTNRVELARIAIRAGLSMLDAPPPFEKVAATA
ncbi:MAG: helix-turn-helix transcriptional regulator [Planctomycetota bacterium]|nr:helix-turn-helix transcriptional regulator [Planctomycetota bacterium]